MSVPGDEIKSSASVVVEDNDYISGVLEDKDSYGLFCAPKTANQLKLVKRTIHWLDFSGIMGNSRIIISFKDTTKDSGRCKPSKGTTESFEFMYSASLTEDDIDSMLCNTCPHQVAHAIVHTDFPNGGVTPHGEEWKQAVKKMIGITPSSAHDLDTIKRVQSNYFEYAFCGCDQGRGTTPLSSDVLQRLRSGEALSCTHCGLTMHAASKIDKPNSISENSDIKNRVEQAVREAKEEMQECIERENIQSQEEESDMENIVLFCNCVNSKNSVLFSELPEFDTLVCEKCNAVFRPLDGVLRIE